MSRVRTFGTSMTVADQLAAVAVGLDAEVRNRLARRLSGDARGPRGGRYRLIGPVFHRGPERTGDDFMRGTVTYVAERRGQYIRPQS